MILFSGMAGQERNAPSWDIVFLISGKPLPAMLDLAYFAQKSGLRTLTIILERGMEDLVIDRALVNHEVIIIDVPYRGVELKRLTSIPLTYRKLKSIITGGLTPNGIIVTAAYDLLLFTRLLAIGRNYSIRHQVRDLHALQLSGSLRSFFFVQLEKFLLRRVDRIIVSSPEFVNKYYRNIYQGKSILVENTPSRQTWADFKRVERKQPCFRIGYIGVIRYKESIKQLIAAAEILAAEGLPVKVLFAGGGDVSDLTKEIRQKELFEFLGPYEYTKDIKALYSDIDLIYSVYDSNDLNCQLAMPNKFYESIISKIPILVAKKTFLEQEVMRLGIGEAVLSGDVPGLVDLLRRAIVSGDWYARAQDRLQECDANSYYDDYEKALHESILA